MTIQGFDDRDNDASREDKVLAELKATRQEIRALHRLFDDFAAAYLQARFPFGRAVDRWARR